MVPQRRSYSEPPLNFCLFPVFFLVFEFVSILFLFSMLFRQPLHEIALVERLRMLYALSYFVSALFTRTSIFSSSFYACSEYDVRASYCVFLFSSLSLCVYLFLSLFFCLCFILFLCSFFPSDYVCASYSLLSFVIQIFSHT